MVKLNKKKLSKVYTKKVTYNKGKSNKMTLKLKDFKAPSVLGDENRFFKGQLEETKRSMFL